MAQHIDGLSGVQNLCGQGQRFFERAQVKGKSRLQRGVNRLRCRGGFGGGGGDGFWRVFACGLFLC
jgi:hypothetical protein